MFKDKGKYTIHFKRYKRELFRRVPFEQYENGSSNNSENGKADCG
jgi:hypothetical protein